MYTHFWVFPGVIWPKFELLERIATYWVSVSSLLSVAEPKYLRPLALARVLSWARVVGRSASVGRRNEICIVEEWKRGNEGAKWKGLNFQAKKERRIEAGKCWRLYTKSHLIPIFSTEMNDRICQKHHADERFLGVRKRNVPVLDKLIANMNALQIGLFGSTH